MGGGSSTTTRETHQQRVCLKLASAGIGAVFKFLPQSDPQQELFTLSHGHQKAVDIAFEAIPLKARYAPPKQRGRGVP